jgi:hypothetical protein
MNVAPDVGSNKGVGHSSERLARFELDIVINLHREPQWSAVEELG